MKAWNGYWYQVIYSPDEIGYYSEIIDPKGKTIHQTELVGDQGKANQDAMEWIDQKLEIQKKIQDHLR